MSIRFSVALVLSLMLSSAWGATCTSKATGNWNASSTWTCTAGTTPAAGDDVVMANSYTVTVTASTTVNNVAVSGTSSNTTLTINGGVTLTANGNVTINAPTTDSRTNLISLGTAGAVLNVGGNLAINSGTSSSRVAGLTIGNSATNVVDVNGDITFSGTASAARLTFSGAGTLNAAGNVGSGGTLASGSGTVVYNGSGAQAIGPYAYNALTINNPGGTATAYADLSAASLTINSGGTLAVPSTYKLTLSGDFSNAGTYAGAGGSGAVSFGGNFTNTGSYTGGSGNTSVTGNFSNTGTFTSGNGTWTFNGGSTQTVTGATTFANFTINNSHGITLANNVTVGTLMTFTANGGDVATGANVLILSAACTGSYTGASANGYVNGNVRLTFPAGAATCVFPVGDATVYTPITVAASATSVGGTLTGSTAVGEAPQFWNSGVDATQFVNRYWTLGLTSGDTFTSFPSGATYDVTLQFASGDVSSGATVSTFQVGLFANGWSTLGGSAGGANGTSSTTAKLTGQNVFGRYVVGKPLSACTPPSNIPAGVTVSCVCDNFTRTTLNPSTIYGGNWLVSNGKGTFTPSIVNSGRLQLTQNVNDQATAATVPGIFPAAGNYISVEFKHYAYHSTSYDSVCGSSQTGNCSGHPTTGADGIVITLSDYAVPAQPGAYGGSLGYAQMIDPAHPTNGSSYTQNGFAGGWVGIALDEWGNYQNGNEGRQGGKPYGSGGSATTTGNYYESVGARGSGSGLTGYKWFAGTTSQSSKIDNYTSSTPNPGYSYQVVVDARNYLTNGTTGFSVNRDTGSGYSSLISVPDIFSAASSLTSPNTPFTQDPVPTNWQISFTAGTGGENNIHEIAGMRVCAQSVFAPTAGNSASPLTAIDEAYGLAVGYNTASQGRIFTKLAGVPFTLGVIAFSGNQINTQYANDVTVQLIDDSVGPTCKANASACTSCSKPVIVNNFNGTSSQTVKFKGSAGTGDGYDGQVQTGTIRIDSAYSRVIARLSDGTITGCSDAFTVRPTGFSGVTSSASNAALSSTPALKAGTDSFSLTVATAAGNYTGMPQINPAQMVAGPNSTGTGWTVGALSPTSFRNNAVNSLATDTFTYSEVGNFSFLGYDPTASSFDTTPRGIADTTWTIGSDDNGLNGDCIAGSYSNVKSTSGNLALYGRYGCNFGIVANTAIFGRFFPDHFQLASGSITPAVAGTGGSTPSKPFTYMGAPKLGISYVLNACAGPAASGCSITANYEPTYVDSGGHTQTKYPVTAPVLVAEDMANPGYELAAARITPSLPTTFAWGAGIYTMSAPAATFSLPSPGTRPGGAPATSIANAGGAFDQLVIGVNMTDADGGVIYNNDINAGTTGTCSGSGCNAKSIGTTAVRQGRMIIGNAYGSELLTLPVRAIAQYYNYDSASGTGTWLTNADDTGTGATVIPIGAAVLSNPVARKIGAAPTAPIICFVGAASCTASLGQLSPTDVTLVKGIGTFTLKDSNTAQGTIDMAINLDVAGTDVSCNTSPKATTGGVGMAWLRYGWCAGGLHDPNARFKFGSSKAPYIYLREMY